MTITDEEIEEVNEFMYLGSKITNDGDVTAELNNRISKAAYAIHRLNKIWKDKNISLKTKMKLYRSNVVSSLTYGCETWQLTTSQENKLNAFDYTSLRRIMKIDWREHITNEEIRARVKIPSVIDTIKKRRLNWFGHLIRMDRSRIARQLLFWEPETTESIIGRPPMA